MPRSKFEESVIEKHPTWIYEPKGCYVEYLSIYKPDFLVDDGIDQYLVETKGYFPAEDRAKMAKVYSYNPGLDLRIIFQSWATIKEAAVKRFLAKHQVRFAVYPNSEVWYQYTKELELLCLSN